MNINLVHIPHTLRYGIECDSYRVQKYFPQTYKALQEQLTKITRSYYTPFPMPALEEDFKWKDGEYTGVMFLTAFKMMEDGAMVKMETLVLQETNVFIMNQSGATIDKLQI